MPNTTKTVRVGKNAKVDGLSITEHNTTDSRTIHNETINIPKVENNTNNNYTVTVNQGDYSGKKSGEKTGANAAVLEHLSKEIKEIEHKLKRDDKASVTDKMRGSERDKLKEKLKKLQDAYDKELGKGSVPEM